MKPKTIILDPSIPNYDEVFLELENIKVKCKITVKKISDAQIRTLKQNDSLHDWFQKIADDFIKIGVPLEEKIGSWNPRELMWTGEHVKDKMFKHIVFSISGQYHTSKLTKKQFQECVEEMRNWLATSWGSEIKFPSQEALRVKIFGY